jgi:hypothetical protein
MQQVDQANLPLSEAKGRGGGGRSITRFFSQEKKIKFFTLCENNGNGTKLKLQYINALIKYEIKIRVRAMVFNTTFNNISVISWRSVLLVSTSVRLLLRNNLNIMFIFFITIISTCGSVVVVTVW